MMRHLELIAAILFGAMMGAMLTGWPFYPIF